MLRRHAIAALLAGAAPLRAQKGLATVVVDVPSRELIAVDGADLASGALLPPGSTMKPFALATLLESGKLREADTYYCPGTLMLDGQPVVCAHPPLGEPVRVRTALALARFGMTSRTGWFGEAEAVGQVPRAEVRAISQLQAIGEAGVLLTPAELAAAYRRLALTSGRRGMESILAGLEDAVEFGTAQKAKVDGLKVAGKTGSIRAADGAPIAWFAGFAPSRAPKVAVVVMAQAKSGGADAAPIAASLLKIYARERL